MVVVDFFPHTTPDARVPPLLAIKGGASGNHIGGGGGAASGGGVHTLLSATAQGMFVCVCACVYVFVCVWYHVYTMYDVRCFAKYVSHNTQGIIHHPTTHNTQRHNT